MPARTAPTATPVRHGSWPPDHPDRQKQVDEAIDRGMRNKKPVGKCRVALSKDGIHLTFYHYTHTLLVYDLARGRALMTWSEKPTDRRILRAALANLEARYGRGAK